jgi:hypothetical protein
VRHNAFVSHKMYLSGELRLEENFLTGTVPDEFVGLLKIGEYMGTVTKVSQIGRDDFLT